MREEGVTCECSEDNGELCETIPTTATREFTFGKKEIMSGVMY